VTTYISDTPTGAGAFFLWADDEDEAFCAALAVGAGPEPSPWHTSWTCYLLTAEQMADAIDLGVTITDRFGPAIWCAKRDKDHKRLRILEDARARA